MQITCSTPAKLILSGEHAALYNCSALSMAIQLYTTCECRFSANQTSSVTIELVDYQQSHNFPTQIWHNLAIDIESRYHLFQQQTVAIQSVLAKPVDLPLIILHHFDLLYTLKQGHWHFKIKSQAPIGRGLGSSASVIVSMLSTLFETHQLPHDHKLLELAQLIENRQHGKSSGIDTTTVHLGGLVEFKNRCPQKLTDHELSAWLIDTGKPASSTGQAVSHVRNNFADNSPLWSEFNQTTETVIKAWNEHDQATLLQALDKNQQLLEIIEVVPEKVKTFIQRLKQELQATAKICGSGSVKGDNAGIVLCFSKQPPTQLCEEFGYSLQAVKVDNKGSICQQ